MGTVALAVKAGVITDTGNFFLVGPGTDLDFPEPPAKLTGSEAGLYRPAAGSAQWGTLAFGLPDTLKTYPNAQADFRAHGKIDNFYKVAVGRMPPVPGVLAYERDKIIDLRAAAEKVGDIAETVAPAEAADLECAPSAENPATPVVLP